MQQRSGCVSISEEHLRWLSLLWRQWKHDTSSKWLVWLWNFLINGFRIYILVIKNYNKHSIVSIRYFLQIFVRQMLLQYFWFSHRNFTKKNIKRIHFLNLPSLFIHLNKKTKFFLNLRVIFWDDSIWLFRWALDARELLYKGTPLCYYKWRLHSKQNFVWS